MHVCQPIVFRLVIGERDGLQTVLIIYTTLLLQMVCININ